MSPLPRVPKVKFVRLEIPSYINKNWEVGIHTTDTYNSLPTQHHGLLGHRRGMSSQRTDLTNGRLGRKPSFSWVLQKWRCLWIVLLVPLFVGEVKITNQQVWFQQLKHDSLCINSLLGFFLWGELQFLGLKFKLYIWSSIAGPHLPQPMVSPPLWCGWGWWWWK